MRQVLLFFVLFTCILPWTSCRKESPVGPSATVKVSIKTVFGDEPFIAGKEYDYPSEGSIRFNGLSMFLSDISLVAANGTDEIALDDVAFLDVASIQHDESTSEKGWIQTYYKVPLGDYTGIKFGLGVAHEENNQSPKNFSSGNPLGVDNRYSSQYLSYVFEDIAGQYYQGDDTTSFSIKIVEDKMFKQVSISKGFSINDSGNDLEIIFDLKKVFQRNDSIMSLKEYPLITSPALPQMDWLGQNFQHSFSF